MIKDYKAYLTSKMSSNHSRKKASIGLPTGNKIQTKEIVSCKSASKLTSAQLPKNDVKTKTNARKSLNLNNYDTKVFGASIYKKAFDHPAYMTKSGQLQSFGSPTSFISEIGFRTSSAFPDKGLKQPTIDLQKDKHCK